MRIQEHLGKISWSIADKMLFIVYGLVSIVQMNFIPPAEFGLFALLISVHTWIFIISDAFALQNIVQFGINPKNTKKVNLYSLILHLCVCIIIPGILFILQSPFAELFHEKRLIDIASILPLFCLVSVPRTYCLKFVYRDFKMNRLFMINVALFLPLTLFTIYYIFVDHSLDFNKMLIMYIGSHAISSIVAIILTFKQLKFGIKGELRVKELIKFGVPMTITNSLHSLPKQLDVYAITLFFNSAEIVGIYYSAKSLFRVFEETLSAATGLIYPAIVRQIEKKDISSLKVTLTKGVSFLFIVFICILIPLELGLSDFMIRTFLTPKYFNAIGLFNTLSLSALFLPFYLFSILLIAETKPIILLKYVVFSIIVFIAVFYMIGLTGDPSLIPYGYVCYSATLGLTCANYYRKNYGYKFSEIFRSVRDMKYFILSKVNKG